MMSRRIYLMLIILVLTLSTASCGQKGDLYLPDRTAAAHSS